MKTVDIAEVTTLLATYAREENQEPVILMAKKKPIALLLPVGDADLETVSLSMNPKFLAIIEESRRCHEAEGGISSEEMCRRYGVRLPGPRDATGKSRKRKSQSQQPSGKKDAGQV